MIETPSRQLHGGQQIAVGGTGIDADLIGRNIGRGKGGVAEDDCFAEVMSSTQEGLANLAEIGLALPGEGQIGVDAGMDEKKILRLEIGLQ